MERKPPDPLDHFLQAIKLKGSLLDHKNWKHIILITEILTPKTQNQIYNIFKENDYDDNWKDHHNRTWNQPVKINTSKYLATLVISLYSEYMFNCITKKYDALDEIKLKQLKSMLHYYELQNCFSNEGKTLTFINEQSVLKFFFSQFTGNCKISHMKEVKKKRPGTINQVYILWSSMGYVRDNHYYDKKHELKKQVLYEIISMTIHQLMLKKRKKFDYSNSTKKIVTDEIWQQFFDIMKETTYTSDELEIIPHELELVDEDIIIIDDNNNKEQEEKMEQIEVIETPKGKQICKHKKKCIEYLDMVEKQNMQIMADVECIARHQKETQMYMDNTLKLDKRIDSLKIYLKNLENDISAKNNTLVAIQSKLTEKKLKNQQLQDEIKQLSDLLTCEDEKVLGDSMSGITVENGKYTNYNKNANFSLM
eukprot:298900_1